MKLLCVTCPNDKKKNIFKKEALFITYGHSLCDEHYNKRIDRIECMNKCGIELAKNPTHRHIKVKEDL